MDECEEKEKKSQAYYKKMPVTIYKINKSAENINQDMSRKKCLRRHRSGRQEYITPLVVIPNLYLMTFYSVTGNIKTAFSNFTLARWKWFCHAFRHVKVHLNKSLGEI